MSNIKIVRGTVHDAQAISKVGKDAFSSAFLNPDNRQELLNYLEEEYSEGTIRQVISSPKVRVQCAKKNGQLMGFAQLHIEPIPSGSANAMKMERLYILPSTIGTGIGRLLMEDALKVALDEGFDTFWLMVLRGNNRARRFYDSFGFEVFGESPGKFKADGKMDDWMKLELKT